METHGDATEQRGDQRLPPDLSERLLTGQYDLQRRGVVQGRTDQQADVGQGIAVNFDDFGNGLGKGYFTDTPVDNGLAISFVPEPGALGMALAALAMLLCRRRRR